MDGNEEEEEDDEMDEDIEEVSSSKKRMAKFKAYVDPRELKTVKKTIVRKKVASSSKVFTPTDRPGTRDTTRARTEEVIEKVEKNVSSKRLKSPRDPLVLLTQEELMEEARLTEEWNTADYDAYISYMELNEKIDTSRRRGKKNSNVVISRSFIENGYVKSELIVPAYFELVHATLPNQSAKYRYPKDPSQVFNTVEEFSKIHENFIQNEVKNIQEILKDINRYNFS